MRETPRRLPSAFIPQASPLERVISVVKQIAAGCSPHELPGFEREDDRTRNYFLKAGTQLGFLDSHRNVTPLGRKLAHDSDSAALATFAEAFRVTPCGAAWLAWAGANSVEELDPRTAQRFLRETTDLSKNTSERRASPLINWVRTIKSGRLASAGEARQTSKQAQLTLPSVAPPQPSKNLRSERWPTPSLFPHNEDGNAVGDWLDNDLLASKHVAIITGYASLDEVIRFLADRDLARSASTRVLFGSEPFPSRERWSRPVKMADDVRDYWLDQGISPLLCGAVLRAREAVATGKVLVRIGPDRRLVHAKIYVGDDAATIGSSNFTRRGRGAQSEANVRFEKVDRTRFRQAQWLADAMWNLGEDYSSALLALLDELLKQVTWREALARACAAILEGEWARKYIPADITTVEPLWPHQLQGISQALWILENVGSVLVADAAGSGKTRMGAWLLRGAHDRYVRSGQMRTGSPVVVSPPQVLDRWEDELRGVHLGWKVFSQGLLSNQRAELHGPLVDTIRHAELLAVDEAHNFLNESDRTRRLLCHYADHAVLFTATPINRNASDLLAMVELLGADNLTDEALEIVGRLARWRRGGNEKAATDGLDQIRDEVEKFMVRRTRKDLNAIVEERPTDYVMRTGRSARYPQHRAAYYNVASDPEDLAIAAEIEGLADMLTGVARIGRKLSIPASLAMFGWTEKRYLEILIGSSRSLARHTVLDCLRSSRAALYEHVHGTEVAWARFMTGPPSLKKESGDTVRRLENLAGSPPDWEFKTLAKDEASVHQWLWDPEAHAEQCRAEAKLYRRIAELTLRLSPAREGSKLEHVAQLARDRLVISFDSHLISLAQFEEMLKQRGISAHLFTGQGGEATKKRATRILGLGTRARAGVALCSDVLSEGVNLQGASCVVHLDTPTVIRTAEQRAGRVDRMDSPHDMVEIWWPKDPPAFAPRKRDLLRERHEVVSKLIRANLSLPHDDRDATLVDVEDLASRTNPERDDGPDLSDAFRPVRQLIGTDGLVSRDTYTLMRTSQADVVACVSVVRSSAEWAFMAVGGAERVAPRWVYFGSPQEDPTADLARVSVALRQRLGADCADLPLDRDAERVMSKFLDRLRLTERRLLPMRRQRALMVAEQVFQSWLNEAWGQPEREAILHGMLDLVRVRSEEGNAPSADLRQVADLFLRLIEPVRRRSLEIRRKGRKLWRLDDLIPDLQATRFSNEQLSAAFAKVRPIPPIDRRVVAMIVGVRH